VLETEQLHAILLDSKEPRDNFLEEYVAFVEKEEQGTMQELVQKDLMVTKEEQ
jgi:hypothetical protein